MKKKILALREGKIKMGLNLYNGPKELQNKLLPNQYLLYWIVADKKVVYIDKDNILTGAMSEKVFDTIDELNEHGNIE